MSKDGLKKVYLIKSAGFEFSEIDLTDNTLLLGESGVGKTTIMRAVLFFYTMDYSDSILNLTSDTKKSFNDWYFKEHNSHVVYEYTKGDSRFLFVVNKSGKLHYTFIDITNSSLGVRELFIDEKMPINLEKLNENIQRENLPNYSTTIRDKYINTLHKKDSNNKKIKQESVVDFSLFENINYTKEFAKTLSNIFISSKVNSSSIKRSIVSLIENSDAKIDLNEIRVNLDEYVSHKDEIEKFENKIPNIEKLSQKLDEYNANRKEFKVRANELYALKQQVSMKMQEIMMKTDSLDEQKSKLKTSFSIAIETIDKKIDISSKEVIEQEKELKDLKQKEREYKEKNIDALVAESEKEQNYNNQLDTHKERYKALTAEFDSLKDKYQKIADKLKKDADDEILNLKEKNIQISKKIDANKNSLIEGKEQNIKDKTQRYRDEKDSFASSLEEEEKRFTTIDKELIKVEYFHFNQEKTGQYKDEIKRYEEELTDTKISINNNTIDIDKIEQEIKGIEKELKESNEKLDSDVKKQKDELFKQKEDVEKKLDFDKDNLYGYLNKHRVENREKIITYLKDDILFSDKSFSVTQSGEANLIFGLNIQFDKEFENDYEQSKLLSKLKLIKDSIKQINKDTIRKKQLLEDEASQNTKVKNRQRAILYQQKVDLEQKKKSYLENTNLSKLNLENAKQEALQQKKEKIVELQEQYLSSKEIKKELGLKIDNLTQEIESITRIINQDVKKTVNEYSGQLKELELSQTSKIQNIKIDCNQKIDSSNKELSLALQNNGVDEALLLSISNEIRELTTKLSEIDTNRTTVTVYLVEYKDKIKQIPSLDEKLASDSKYLHDLKQRKIEIQEANKSEKLELESKRKSLESAKNEIDNFSKTYKQNIENQEIEKKIKVSLSLQSHTLDENIKITADIVDNIIKVYNDIKSAQETVESSVIKIIQNLKNDNIFKIEIPNDFISDSSYLKTAKELIEYMKNDKLSIFKDASLDKFKSNINYIKKQLGVFEDALLDIEGEVKNLRNTIKKAIGSFKVIDDIDIRFLDANNNVLNTLKSLSSFYDKNNNKFLSGLFDSYSDDKASQRAREELREKIVELVKLLNVSKEYLELENGFVLEFKVIERGNDLKWRQTLSDIGSTGTSTLVKSIINISMLKMVSKNIVKNSEIVTHCILDEIGTISTEYFRELKDFVNDSGFVFLNGMPTEDDMLISMYPNIYVGQNFGKYSKMILASKMEI